MRILSIATALIFLVSGSAFAADVTPNIDKGTKTIRLAGRIDTDTPLDYNYAIGAGFGYFVTDGFELGLGGLLRGNDLYTNYDFGVYGQYNIKTGSAFVPFGFLGLYYAGIEVDDDYYNRGGETDFDTAVGKIGAGVAYFVRDNISIEASGVYNWANDPLWIDQDGNVQDSNFQWLLGLRFYWD